MEMFECPKCGKVAYSASKNLSNVCPYCDTEKLLVFNSNIVGMSQELSDAKIIIDRRTSQKEVSIDRRDDVHMVPVAWFVVKQKDSGKV